MWAKASVDYSSPILCGRGCYVPLGLHPAETHCWFAARLQILLHKHLMGEFVQRGRQMLNVDRATCSCRCQCCPCDDAVGCLPLSLPVSLIWVGVMRNLHKRAKLYLTWGKASLHLCCCLITGPLPTDVSCGSQKEFALEANFIFTTSSDSTAPGSIHPQSK